MIYAPRSATTATPRSFLSKLLGTVQVLLGTCEDVRACFDGRFAFPALDPCMQHVTAVFGSAQLD